MNRINIDGIEYDLMPSKKETFFWTDELVMKFRLWMLEDHELSNISYLDRFKALHSHQIKAGKQTANDVLNTEFENALFGGTKEKIEELKRITANDVLNTELPKSSSKILDANPRGNHFGIDKPQNNKERDIAEMIMYLANIGFYTCPKERYAKVPNMKLYTNEELKKAFLAGRERDKSAQIHNPYFPIYADKYLTFEDYFKNIKP